MLSSHSTGMVQALHLTRAGQLAKATVVLQTMLAGEAMLHETEAKEKPALSASSTMAAADAAIRFSPFGFRDFGGSLPSSSLPPVDIGWNLPSFDISAKSKPPKEPGQFLDMHYRNAAGALQYKLYVPTQYRADGNRLPLVVMLHGCTQSADDFARGTRMNRLAEEYGFLVAYPEQSATANISRCWNWFQAKDQRPDQGEPSLIAGVARQVMQSHHVDPARVYAAGLSAGGAEAAILGQLYPDLFAAIGVHSGLACGAARDMPSAMMAMQQGGKTVACRIGGRIVPTISFHGDRDHTVNPRNGSQVIAQASGDGPWQARMQHGQVKEGHAYDLTVMADERGEIMFEEWIILGAAHAWSGGDKAGSYTDPKGPDASREMIRFFLDHPMA